MVRLRDWDVDPICRYFLHSKYNHLYWALPRGNQWFCSCVEFMPRHQSNILLRTAAAAAAAAAAAVSAAAAAEPADTLFIRVRRVWVWASHIYIWDPESVVQ